MSKESIVSFLEGLVDVSDSKKFVSRRKKETISQNVPYDEKEKYLKEGWTIDRELKARVKLIRAKPFDLAFEDTVWSTFAGLGFSQLNRDRHFKIRYDEKGDLTQQVDVVAIDDESILVVECKCAEAIKKSSFKETIEAIGGKKSGITAFLRKVFPERKHKIKFILATKNYILSEGDKERLEHFHIAHFDEEIIQYYQELTRHLGLAARFQLLGNLYYGYDIPELDNQIPAIQGKMGGLTYYSFSIEPEKLLKIGYVLHRNKANKRLMPTYQRIIKKSRLKAIQEFIDEGGFFPNSIIINIDSEKNLRFERANTQVDKAVSKVGVLYLPKQYRSAFIIDGQHRLYGYANTSYKKINSIPVVAFHNLDRNKQVELFMQINENQKAVPKNLRNTLNSDLLWDSENLKESVKALKLQIAQDLGEEVDSALFERVLVGENPKSETRCITLDTIYTAFDRSNFFGVVSKDAIKVDGSFYTGKNESTYKSLIKYLIDCFGYIREKLPTDWDMGEGEKNEGFLSINAGVYSLIVLFSNITDLIIHKKKINPKKGDLEELFDESKYYLDPLITFFKSLDTSAKEDLRKSYGTAGRTKYLRKLQIAIRGVRPQFNPAGLDEELKSLELEFNTKGFVLVSEVEKYLNKDFKERLEDYYKSKWFKKGVPEPVYEEANSIAVKKNREIDEEENEKDPWDCLYIISYRKIALFGPNWSDIFEKPYTRPGEEKVGNKDAKTKWIYDLNEIRNKIMHNDTITEAEFGLLSDIHDWLVRKTVQNLYGF